MEANSNKIYEIGYHILPTVAEEKLAGEVGAIKEVLEKNGAVFVSEDFPKLRPLAYAIRKSIAGKYRNFSSAYFGWLKFELDPATVETVKKVFEENANILRFLLIETVRESTIASLRPAYQAKPREVKRDDAKPVSQEELDKTIDQLVVE